MPVEKFRSIEEVPSLLRPPLDPDNLRIAFELSEFALRLHPRPPRRGVRKFASMEEARAALGDTHRG